MARRRPRSGAPVDGGDAADIGRVADLEAVWGRAASARAEPVGPPSPVVVDRPGPEPAGGRSWWAVAGVIAAAAFVAAGVVAVASGGDDAVDGAPPDATVEDGATTTTEVPPWEPLWDVEVTCPRVPVTNGARTTVCSVAADDDRVYVLEERDDVTTLVARSAGDGGEAWATPLPGATDVERLPATLLVRAPGRVTAVDPGSGAPGWSADGEGVWPAGRDHLLVDDVATTGEDPTSTMTVRDVATGAVVSEVTGPAVDVFRVACADAGVVVDSVGTTLSATPIEGGGPAWSVEAPHHDLFDPVRCAGPYAAAVERGVLVVRRAGAGLTVGSVPVVTPEGGVRVAGMAGPTVVVGAADGLAGYSVPEVEPLWELPRVAGADGALVAGAGPGVGVAVPGDIAAWFGHDGRPGPQLDLEGFPAVVVADGRLVAWGGGALLVAPLVDLSRPRRSDDDLVADVRAAAVGDAHIVVTTRDHVVVLPHDP